MTPLQKLALIEESFDDIGACCGCTAGVTSYGTIEQYFKDIGEELHRLESLEY